MQNEEFFVCLSEECTLNRVLNDWDEIVAHQCEGHEVLLKEDLVNSVNCRITQLKGSLFSDLLARIHKIMVNAEDNLIAKINSQFTEIYQFWKEKLNDQTNQAEFLLPQNIDNNTSARELVEIHLNLQNEQLHFFKDCIYQADEAFLTLQKQVNIQLMKTDSQLKQIIQDLYTQTQLSKSERESKIVKQKSQVEFQETKKEESNDSLSSQVRVRLNQRLDYSVTEESVQIEQYFQSSSKQRQQLRTPSVESPESRQRPLKGYKDYQKLEDSATTQYAEQFHRKNPHSPIQEQERVSEIIYEKPISPPKLPPPLRGYKERQSEPSKVVIQRSNDRRQYIDELLMQDILVLTQKKFDLDRSDKHMKYSNKFGTIFCSRDCFAIVEGSFTLTQHRQINILLRAEGMNYEISVGIVNFTQILQNNMSPDVYGINKQGESLSTQSMTPIRLVPERTYLLAYRHDQHLLIFIDSARNLQHPIQLPQDQQSEFVFFVRMNNVQVSLI